MEFDLGNIIQPNVELHQAEREEPNGLEVGVDKKTAFLTELKALLEKYNTKINVIPFQPITLQFLSDAFALHYTKNITPSNIFDYDK